MVQKHTMNLLNFEKLDIQIYLKLNVCKIMAECFNICICHYNDVIMSAMASQITSLTIVYSTIYSGTDQRKYQSSASMAFVCGDSPVTGEFPAQRSSNAEMFPFSDVIMLSPPTRLFISVLRMTTKNTKSRITAYLWGESTSDSPHKWPVMRKIFPCPYASSTLSPHSFDPLFSVVSLSLTCFLRPSCGVPLRMHVSSDETDVWSLLSNKQRTNDLKGCSNGSSKHIKSKNHWGQD